MKTILKFLFSTVALMLLSALLYGQSKTNDRQGKIQFVQEELIQDNKQGIVPVSSTIQSDFDYKKFVSSNKSRNILYNNGPIITNPGAGSNGSDYSEVQDNMGLYTYGFGCKIGNQYNNHTLADDFEVTEDWLVSTITFYGYQTNIGPPSGVTEIRFRIYDGQPNAGGSVVYGDLTTNKLITTQWTNIWRVMESGPIEERPVMEIVADADGLELSPGTYWIEYQAAGMGDSGPFTPPITIMGQFVTGDALQYNMIYGWSELADASGSAQGLPFLFEGISGALPANELAVTHIISPVTGYGMDEDSVTIRIFNYGTNDQSNFDVSYSVNGASAITETVSATIPAKGSLEYTFDAVVDLSVIGDYSFEACVLLSGDEDPGNDCAIKSTSNLFGATVYPQLADYWTGSTDGTVKTQTSLAQCFGGGDAEAGWMKFDISEIPANVTILDVTFHGYVYETDWPDWSITPLNNDPLFTSAGSLFKEIEASSLEGIAYHYIDGFTKFTPGWHEYIMGNIAIHDFQTSLDQNWFAIGFFNRRYYNPGFPVNFHGWNEENIPYLIVEYEYNGPPPVTCESFDELAEGDYVAGQLEGNWTTWGGTPGGADDAFVSSTYSYSPDNSVAVDDNAVNLLFQFYDEPISSGQWMYSHYMYVPSGKSGYFNIQTDPNPGEGYNIELYFNNDGTGYFDGQSTDVFSFTHDIWFLAEVKYDFIGGNAEVYFDGELISEFDNTMNIGAVNYSGSVSTGVPETYYDDVCFTDIQAGLGSPSNLAGSYVEPDDVQLNWNAPSERKAIGRSLLGFNVYRNNALLDFIADTSYTDENLIPENYNYYITALYDEGESYQSNSVIVTIVDTTINCNNFDNLTTYGYVAEQLGGRWTTENGAPGTQEDAFVVNATANSPENSFLIDGTWNRLMYEFGDEPISSGQWLYSHYMYVPSDRTAYFCVNPEPTQGGGWNLQFHFKNDGTGLFKNQSNQTFTYNHDTWFKVEINYDFTSGFLEVFFDGELILVTENTMTIGSIFYYGSGSYGQPTAYYDDVCFNEGWFTSIDEELKQYVQVYPNPATNMVNIKSDNSINKVTIYNHIGKAITYAKPYDKQMQFDLSKYNTGVYLLRIETEKGIVSKQFVIQ